MKLYWMAILFAIALGFVPGEIIYASSTNDTRPLSISMIIVALIVVIVTANGLRPYRKRYITDSLSKDGSPTNLYGEPVDLENDAFRKQQERVNNELWQRSNDGNENSL